MNGDCAGHGGQLKQSVVSVAVKCSHKARERDRERGREGKRGRRRDLEETDTSISQASESGRDWATGRWIYGWAQRWLNEFLGINKKPKEQLLQRELLLLLLFLLLLLSGKKQLD